MTDEEAIEARNIACELEDHLQSFRFHLNGFDQSKTSMLGTYMGILQYDKIVEAFNALPDLKKWAIAADVWEHDFQSAGSPTFRLLSLEIKRQIAKKEAELVTTDGDHTGTSV